MKNYQSNSGMRNVKMLSTALHVLLPVESYGNTMHKAGRRQRPQEYSTASMLKPGTFAGQ